MKAKAFQFKKFNLQHSASAHKIGTDGILLATWVDASKAQSILDFGSGCGLIAFILAQRFPKMQIHGLEKDTASFTESLHNLEQFPLAHSIHFLLGELESIELPRKYDLIISNPPYFEADTSAPDQRRAQARTIEPGKLINYLSILKKQLNADGTLALILPSTSWQINRPAIFDLGLSVKRICKVRHQKGKDYKRVLIELSQKEIEPLATEMDLYMEDGIRRSDAYQRLCNDFLLDQ